MRRLLAVVVLVVSALVVSVGTSVADPYEEGSFTPINGGEFFADNGNFHWIASPDVYTNALAVRRLPNGEGNLPPRPANTIVIGVPFTLQLIDKTTSSLISLNKPATLSVRYNPADLGGRSESSLHFARDLNHWVDLPTSVDTASHVATIQTPWSGNYVLLANNLLAENAAPVPAAPAPAGAPAFRLGFATLASLIPNVAGSPIENEHYGANGDSLQQTTTGLMVWRKADNWTAFTNGATTWINGPFGVQSRPNSERFVWEK